MTAAGIGAEIDLEGQLELVHRGVRHQLFRGDRRGRRAVVKQLASVARNADAVASLRHEYEVLRAMNVPGVVKVHEIVPLDGGLPLVMHDAGDTNLAHRARAHTLPVAEFLDVATQVAAIVQRLHDAHVVHRNVSPSNIVWDSTARKATLVDFTMATTLSALTVESTSPSLMEGTLSYISPEQTGRTGRTVDSRTDLYSLGATFYEVLTGTPPFEARDPIEVIHAHLAKRPHPPHDKNPAVPATLSEIVLKLLEKEPERRYQTAEGLLADLHTATTQWARTQMIAAFPLATHDVPRALKIPEKLYGRDDDVRVLREAFARAAEGPREFVLVTGAPGIGKSALVRQIEQPVVERHGIFLVGKFDQLQRSVPYAALVRAFRMLVQQLLAEPENVLARWREAIQRAVSPNGAVLVEVLPELERVIGPQPPALELAPEEAKNRLHFVLTAFLRAVARPEHPLALFLDDLQWVDAASLRLIEQWMGDADNRYFLLIGAYRDTETSSLANLREKGTHVVRLEPLGQDDVARLIADSFNQQIDRSTALARVVVNKTGGNPFFVRRLLHALYADGLIRFSRAERAWESSLEEIEHAPASDNVLELMVRSIARLPDATKKLLEAGACIGHRFDLGMLSDVSGHSRADATNHLWPALEDGLLLPLRETYKAPRSAGPLDEHLDALPGQIQFVHDRVQHAAYSLLSSAERATLHLRIGRRMLQVASDDELDERLSMVKVVEQTDRQAKRLTRLVNDMLDVSRINAGRFTLYKERLDLSSVVRETVDRSALVISQSGSDVTVHADGLIPCDVDRFRIEQVVSNLLINAARYGEGRPIEVIVRSSDHGTAELAVRDHGVGIAEDDQTRIFERFERATSLSEGTGLGLGLYIAREIVQGHGGTIRVESKLGRGATFTVRIPTRTAS